MPGSLAVRRSRRGKPVRWRLKKPVWVDPYPQIPGTLPEKMVFAALRARNIYFIFQGEFPLKDRAFSVLLQSRNFQPDFLVPEYKIIFDPFGVFAHSQPDAIKSDFYKELYYRGSGYEFVHPWSDDVVRYGGAWAIDQSRRLHGPPLYPLSKEDAAFKAQQGYRLGPDLGAGSKATAAANRARRRPHAIGIKRRTARRGHR